MPLDLALPRFLGGSEPARPDPARMAGSSAVLLMPVQGGMDHVWALAAAPSAFAATRFSTAPPPPGP